jgi:hypothetical protein
MTKWFSLGFTHFLPSATKTIMSHNGIAYAHFGEPSMIQDLVRRGILTPQQAAFQRKISTDVRGFQTEEYSGFKPFETRSLGGSVRGRLGNFANLVGIPISVMEQLTRYATIMAHYEMFERNPFAVKSAERVLKDDYRFQAMIDNNKEMTFIENAALFGMDEAHAVFGKIGRAPFMRGIGGALPFAFMTYPHQQLEFLARMLGRSKEGRRAFLTTLSSLFIFAGLMGLPGVELLKELLEEIEKQITGSEEDFDLLIREKIYEQTGDVRFSKFVTQGIGRAYGNLDVSGRIGLPIPGQELLLNLLGIKGRSSDLLGVSGSLINGVAQGWQEFNQGSSPTKVLSSLTPVGLSNIIKAVDYTESGISTRNGIKLVNPEDMTRQSVFARAIGFTSDQIATKREEAFYTQLAERKYETGINRYREQTKKLYEKYVKALENGDEEVAESFEDEIENVIINLREFLTKNNIGDFDLPAFIRSVRRDVKQRVTAEIDPKSLRKIARLQHQKIKETLGLD